METFDRVSPGHVLGWRSLLQSSWDSSSSFEQFETLLLENGDGPVDGESWRNVAAFLYRKALATEHASAPVDRARFARGTIEGNMIRAISPGSTPNQTAGVFSPLGVSVASTPPASPASALPQSLSEGVLGTHTPQQFDGPICGTVERLSLSPQRRIPLTPVMLPNKRETISHSPWTSSFAADVKRAAATPGSCKNFGHRSAEGAATPGASSESSDQPGNRHFAEFFPPPRRCSSSATDVVGGVGLSGCSGQAGNFVVGRSPQARAPQSPKSPLVRKLSPSSARYFSQELALAAAEQETQGALTSKGLPGAIVRPPIPASPDAVVSTGSTRLGARVGAAAGAAVPSGVVGANAAGSPEESPEPVRHHAHHLPSVAPPLASSGSNGSGSNGSSTLPQRAIARCSSSYGSVSASGASTLIAAAATPAVPTGVTATIVTSSSMQDLGPSYSGPGASTPLTSAAARPHVMSVGPVVAHAVGPTKLRPGSTPTPLRSTASPRVPITSQAATYVGGTSVSAGSGHGMVIVGWPQERVVCVSPRF